ncbi:MAG: 1-(5-phosphoribosyl)-5-[(5-phosphoribosylamino)methylideneamino]imidazole-4-carboxamide isomerase [Helicobacteraceae bacterium]|jgi:phosphoribosylformimino-5-aminoimidazole carboxamide ribotide isomerase|nr:1-(5-phosphoribosyl)-5-[(5-phosphoribosylamino)methylideneamino]imidazole-4-carboxamide isomerase [Helicobacteraceae bacterium]
MTIFPAIDLKDSKAVRLTQGEMASAKIYGDPSEIAKKFEDAGAKWLHIVDLDGAFSGFAKNRAAIEKIVRATRLKVQIGGGIRNEVTIGDYLNAGASRVILGSRAAKEIAWALAMSEVYPIAIGIDAKKGKVATGGWAETAELDAVEFAARFRRSAVRAVICTDIAKDGALSGVNVDFSARIKEAFGGFTIASGGVTALDDISALSAQGIDGAIVGKAIYEQKLLLSDLFGIKN